MYLHRIGAIFAPSINMGGSQFYDKKLPSCYNISIITSKGTSSCHHPSFVKP